MVKQQIIDLEKQLFKPVIRKDGQALSKLLADDYCEFSITGSIYNKSDVVKRMPLENPPYIKVEQFDCVQLSSDLYQVRYQAKTLQAGQTEFENSLRSSLWRANGDQWQLIFHQGTSA
ncbi:DUF4440 domain-containing protein [Paraferrimonas sp. SM1919]|uniref:nuclear transport factor 2 family protein n=1 Tax=Paraferrimonas sp. SM1919 TaxID=2662263 RepID=UPI0013D6A996|nr:nuclear transport factor 2 family protein [Paraferrimonas sp. SM1919]